MTPLKALPIIAVVAAPAAPASQAEQPHPFRGRPPGDRDCPRKPLPRHRPCSRSSRPRVPFRASTRRSEAAWGQVQANDFPPRAPRRLRTEIAAAQPRPRRPSRRRCSSGPDVPPDGARPRPAENGGLRLRRLARPTRSARRGAAYEAVSVFTGTERRASRRPCRRRRTCGWTDRGGGSSPRTDDKTADLKLSKPAVRQLPDRVSPSPPWPASLTLPRRLGRRWT